MSTESDAVDGVQHEDDRRAMSEEPPEELALDEPGELGVCR